MFIVLCPGHLLSLQHVLFLFCWNVPSSFSSDELRNLPRRFVLCRHGLYLLHLMRVGYLPRIDRGGDVPPLCCRHVSAFDRSPRVDGLLELHRGLGVCD